MKNNHVKIYYISLIILVIFTILFGAFLYIVWSVMYDDFTNYLVLGIVLFMIGSSVFAVFYSNTHVIKDIEFSDTTVEIRCVRKQYSIPVKRILSMYFIRDQKTLSIMMKDKKWYGFKYNSIEIMDQFEKLKTDKKIKDISVELGKSMNMKNRIN